METFKFTLQTATGQEYTYTGTLASLYKHLQANKHLGITVVEDKTKFNA